MPFVVTIQSVQPEERFDALPWTQARIEQSTNFDGPWVPLDTQALSPLDPDPSDPAFRDFTTAQATKASAWFRVVFIDATAAERATEAVHYPPLDGPLSLEEFKRYSNVKSDAKDELLQAMLNAGVGSVAQITSRQLLDLGTTTITRRVGRGSFVRLPDARAITSVTVDGVRLGASEWLSHPEDESFITHLEIADDRRSALLGGQLDRGRVCAVTGEFGVVPIPDDLRELILATAARHYYRRQAGFADTAESPEYGLQSFFRSLPADMQATLANWTVGEALVA